MSINFAIPPAGHSIRHLIDRTAKQVSQIVAKKGIPIHETEIKIKEGYSKRNPNSSANKFPFFDEDNVYNEYYSLRLQCELAGESVSISIKV